MPDRIRWIEHKGAKILLVDFSHLGEEQFIQLIEESRVELIKHEEGSLLFVADITGSITSKEVTVAYKKMKAETERVPRAMSIVGTTGVSRLLANLFKTGAYFAKDMDDAKDWLVKQ